MSISVSNAWTWSTDCESIEHEFDDILRLEMIIIVRRARMVHKLG